MPKDLEFIRQDVYQDGEGPAKAQGESELATDCTLHALQRCAKRHGERCTSVTPCLHKGALEC